jgi:type VI secretion system ImpM family protein
MAEGEPIARSVTLLGKTPARADFIRINHGAPVALAFDEWLQRNLEELVLGGQRAAPQASFLFVPPNANAGLAGLLAPSRDKAGRAFPVAIFSVLPVAIAAKCPGAIPLACSGMLAQARALFAEIDALDHDALKARVAAIEAPAPSAYDEARAAAGELLAQAAPAAWLARVFAGMEEQAAGRALHALTGAAREAAPKPLVLECPVHETVDALFWLALASRGARAPVSFFWTDAASVTAPAAGPSPSRLLLCLAPPPAQMLLHLAAPKPKPGKLQRVVDASTAGASESADSASRQLEKLSQAESLAAFIAAED